MSRRGFAAVWVLALLTVPLAGCFGDDEGIPSNIEVDASDPWVTEGWAQDGQAITQASGQARLVADNASGSGSFTANVTVGGSTFEVLADTFEPLPGKGFMGNGINQSITLHGDTGQGTPELPRTSVVVATWGPMVLSQESNVVPDPLTGEPQLFGHAMVTDAGIRSDEDRRVVTEDGSVYGPAQAGSGQSFPGDHELHLKVASHPAAPVHDDTTVEDNGQLNPQQANASVPFEIAQATASAHVSVSVSPPAGPVPPSEVNASLVSPSGTPLKAATLGGTEDASVTWSLETVPQAGNYTIELTSQGTANWNVTAEVDHPEPFFFHAVYEDVSWQAASSS